MSSNDLVWTLGSLCRLQHIPFSPELLLQQFPPLHDRMALLHAAQAFGFSTGKRQVRAHEVPSLPLPCLAFMKEPGEGQDGQADNARPALLAGIADGRLAFFMPGDETPRTLALEAFVSAFEAEVVLFIRDVPEAQDQDPAAESARFGFRWFIPELLRHKRVWRDIFRADRCRVQDGQHP